MNGNEPLSLYSLNNLVRNTLAQGLPSAYWVVGELSEVRETQAGHCYVELVERDEATQEMVAKARGTIWARIYSLLKPYFLEQTGERFSVGLKVMLKVTVVFHELYGFSLDICDIEPAYTLGDIARRKQAILNRLKAEGVIDLNKELPFPALPQRIAVISSSFAAGYGDFCDQLMNNPYGFVFYPHLFAAPMQGNKVEQGVISALDRIAENIDSWDVVVIIRGGGATSDLSCFDTYDLANNCAQFPLPIITGIGHQRDDTVLDAVAHTRAKTPTAAAELLIHAVAAQSAMLEDVSARLGVAARSVLETRRRQLAATLQRLPVSVALYLQRQGHRLDMWEQRAKAASPERILSLGYGIMRVNGRVVRSIDDVEEGAQLVTTVAGGSFTSVVTEKNKNNE